MTELRRDPVDGKWVIIAPERRKRKVVFHTGGYEKSSGPCPFCEGKESLTPPEIFSIRDPSTKPNGPGWRVRVIPNKFPILKVEESLSKEGVGYYDRMGGLGAHEVIIEASEHNILYSQYSIDKFVDIFKTYRERVVDLKRDVRLRYILIFKNYGEAAGASMEHPHSQLIALPILPKQIIEEIRGAKEYYGYKDRCVFCDIIHQELDDGERVIFENKNFIAIVPWAPIFPFEIWVIPKTHSPVFELSGDDELYALSEALSQAHRRLDIVLEKPNFNQVLHNLPFSEQNKDIYHWHLEIMPRITKVAGFEYGSGFYINPVEPELSAEYLRKADIG